MNIASRIGHADRSSQIRTFPVRSIRWLAERLSPTPKPSPTTMGTDLQPRHPWAKPAAILLACQIAIALTIAMTTGLLIMHLREHALTEATNEQRRLSLILADQAERAFEAVGLVQTSLVKQLQHDDVRTPAAFRQYMSGPRMQAELSGRGRMLPQLDAITIVDLRGNLINSSVPIPGPEINVADRDYFVGLRDDPGRTVFISQPLLNRRNGQWAAYVARKVTGPDGELLGLILGSLRLRYFRGTVSRCLGRAGSGHPAAPPGRHPAGARPACRLRPVGAGHHPPRLAGAG